MGVVAPIPRNRARAWDTHCSHVNPAPTQAAAGTGSHCSPAHTACPHHPCHPHPPTRLLSLPSTPVHAVAVHGLQLKEQFVRNKDVKDHRVVDMLVIKVRLASPWHPSAAGCLSVGAVGRVSSPSHLSLRRALAASTATRRSRSRAFLPSGSVSRL